MTKSDVENILGKPQEKGVKTDLSQNLFHQGQDENQSRKVGYSIPKAGVGQ
ncbi:MAG: hypothetical protein LC674_04195 [Actinobacteria bacterium]|nr:hypothetical protein [Actinomycetota bacterium]